MLKIKDNVDLKELEKFGFKHIREQDGIYEHYMYEMKTKNEVYPMLKCVVWCFDRHIKIFDKGGEEKLFDLIQAGLVEKVEG